MKVSDFNYDLPSELIAQIPLPSRDGSRMMVLDRETGHVSHASFREFPEYFQKRDVLILNDSRVIPARIWGKIRDKEVEFLFLQKINEGVWEVLCRPAKRVRPGDRIEFGKDFFGEVVDRGEEGRRTIHFPYSDVLTELKKRGYAPLPPYIKRSQEDRKLRKQDIDRYQTVFADEEGSIAAPTAGLHFTPDMIAGLRNKGVETAFVSLHVGLATFQPVRADQVEEHRMLEEFYSLSPQTADLVNRARAEGRHVTAVGTTSVRTLESSVKGTRVEPGDRSTNLFIYPGYEFKAVDRLLTNFHLPQSTLLMLVAAFAGYDLVMQAYREAVRERYRFYSYGDCMLIL